MEQISRDFYLRDPLIVAKELLGKIIVRTVNGQTISGRIVETEAYLSQTDPAAHSYKGKTKRNQSLYKIGGHLYVHSMHMQNCLDIVTGLEDIPSSVLIRALEPISGIELMKINRNKELLTELTSGPGKLCQALMINKALDGQDLCNSSEITLVSDDYSMGDITTTTRVGLSTASEFEYRFYITGSPFVSKK